MNWSDADGFVTIPELVIKLRKYSTKEQGTFIVRLIQKSYSEKKLLTGLEYRSM